MLHRHLSPAHFKSASIKVLWTRGLRLHFHLHITSLKPHRFFSSTLVLPTYFFTAVSLAVSERITSHSHSHIQQNNHELTQLNIILRILLFRFKCIILIRIRNNWNGVDIKQKNSSVFKDEALQRCRFVWWADFSLFGGGRKKLPPVLVIIVEISGVSVMRGHRRVDSKKND